MKRSNIDFILRSAEVTTELGRSPETIAVLLSGVYQVLIAIAEHMGIIEEDKPEITENNEQES